MEKNKHKPLTWGEFFSKLSQREGVCGDVLNAWETYLQTAFDRWSENPYISRCVSSFPAARDVILARLMNVLEQKMMKLGYVRQEEVDALELRVRALEADVARLRAKCGDTTWGSGIRC